MIWHYCFTFYKQRTMVKNHFHIVHIRFDLRNTLNCPEMNQTIGVCLDFSHLSLLIIFLKMKMSAIEPRIIWLESRHSTSELYGPSVKDDSNKLLTRLHCLSVLSRNNHTHKNQLATRVLRQHSQFWCIRSADGDDCSNLEIQLSFFPFSSMSSPFFT